MGSNEVKHFGSKSASLPHCGNIFRGLDLSCHEFGKCLEDRFTAWRRRFVSNADEGEAFDIPVIRCLHRKNHCDTWFAMVTLPTGPDSDFLVLVKFLPATR